MDVGHPGVALVYLEPPVPLIWAALMFGEVIQWTTYLGITVVAAGILVARRQGRADAAGHCLHASTEKRQ